MKNYIQPGDLIEVAAPAPIKSGDGVKIGALFGIAAINAETGEAVNIKTTGVFEVAKADADEISVGDVLYWDDTTKEVTTTEIDASVGVAVAAASANSPMARVRLDTAH